MLRCIRIYNINHIEKSLLNQNIRKRQLQKTKSL